MRLAFMVFLAVVTVTAVFSGVRSALVTAMVSIIVVDFFFLLPRGSLRIVAGADLVMLIVYGGTALGIGWLTGRLRADRLAAQQKAAKAAELAAFLERQLRETERTVEALTVLQATRSELRESRN
jgi:two-component system, OmpR family, sensor histidine kinase KdpD